MVLSVVVSLFPGVDLFGRAFELEGYTVLRGPDPIFGGDIRDFTLPRGVTEGIIAGSPCQDFSVARRSPATGYGILMIHEFSRVVLTARPEWALLENVPGVPDVELHGYTVQRLNLRASECGCRQRRLRTFQFASRDGVGLVLESLQPPAREVEPCAMASEADRTTRRSWADFVELQGLPRDYSLPGFTKRGKYEAVGNGVPVPMGRVLAIAIKRRAVTRNVKTCICNCGRPISGMANHASAACRKRMERRRRVTAGVTGPGCVTAPTSP